MSNELVYFDKGLKYGETSGLQAPGSLQTAENIDFTVTGEQTLRPDYTAYNSTPLPFSIHSIQRFGDYVIIGEGSNLWWRSSAGEFQSTQDFTAFDETDIGANRIQNIASTSVDLVNADNDELVYLTDDYGLNYFTGDYTHYVTINASQVQGGIRYVWGLAKGVGTTLNNRNDYHAIGIDAAGANLRIWLLNREAAGVVDTDNYATASISTNYYLIIQKSMAASTYGTLTCKIYSSSAYSTLVDTLSITLGLNNQFQYLYAVSGSDAGGGGVGTSVTISNLYISTANNASSTNAIYQFQEYKDLLHMVNGTDRYFFDTSGRLYDATVANPTTAPTLTAAAGVGTLGNYKGYVSYLITWPGGQTYETGISTGSAEVTTSAGNLQIDWTSIPLCPYLTIAGSTEPTIYRKLYRGPGAGATAYLGGIFLVATIADNTTTTYTDNITDLTVIANGLCTVTDYGQPTDTDPKYLAYHYSRLFIVHSSNVHRLWYSEAPAGATASANENIIPLAFKSTNWDDMRAAGYGGKVDPQGLISWGQYLYIPLKHTWIQKVGNSPLTWSYRKTSADIGISAPYTLDICSRLGGILGVSTPMGGTPGISLFNGQNAVIITKPEFNFIFESDLNQDYISKCRGKWDGKYYHLLYPNGSQTDVNKHAAFDLTRYPDIRLAFWEDLSPRSIDVYNQGNEVYMGGSDGKVRYNTGTETFNVDIKTHDLVGRPEYTNRKKKLRSIKYAINTGGVDVLLELEIDGSTKKWADGNTYKLISGSSDAVQYDLNNLPQDFEGYKYAIRLRNTGTGYTTFKLYSPWTVEFELTVRGDALTIKTD